MRVGTGSTPGCRTPGKLGPTSSAWARSPLYRHSVTSCRMPGTRCSAPWYRSRRHRSQVPARTPAQARTGTQPAPAQAETYPAQAQAETYPAQAQAETYPAQAQAETYPAQAQAQAETYP